MNWLKENALAGVVFSATLIIGGALSFLMARSMSQYNETLNAYQQAVLRLHALQNRSPFPSVENLEKSRVLAQEYRTQLNWLRAELAKLQWASSANVQPQTFQDDLRVAVNQIVERAAAAGVELPKGFYLGFAQYANSLPSERAAPVLARQLHVIEKVVTNLIDFKVQSIDSLNRMPLPEEAATSPPTQTSEPRKRASEPAPKSASFTRLPFDLSFTAEQGKLHLAFNSLLDPEYFLIVRNLALQNTSRTGPPISRYSEASGGAGNLQTNEVAARKGRSPEGRLGTQKIPEPAGTLNVILGRELVRASMHIEIIDFPTPSEPKG